MENPVAQERPLVLDNRCNGKQIIHLLRICHRVTNIVLCNVHVTDDIAMALAQAICRQADSIKSL